MQTGFPRILQSTFKLFHVSRCRAELILWCSNKNSIFYSDDGGLRATHEHNEPGDVIYYLGIIDCLTHVCPQENTSFCGV